MYEDATVDKQHSEVRPDEQVKPTDTDGESPQINALYPFVC